VQVVLILRCQLIWALFLQIIAEVEGIKEKLIELNTVVSEAKNQQKAQEQECKRIQKEMDEFKNNKDSKLKEIKVLSSSSKFYFD